MKEETFFSIIRSNRQEIMEIIERLPNYYVSKLEPKLDKSEVQKIKNGKPCFREICKSIGRLKVIQKSIHRNLLSKMSLPYYVVGSVKGVSNVDNARYHKGQNYFFQTDIVNFYGAITNKMVFSCLKEIFGFKVATLLTKLTTYKGHLPQGTPTSPILANLVPLNMDTQLVELSNKVNVKYTRYVDDLTFSSSVDIKEQISNFISIVENFGFKISHKKTTYQGKPIITGVHMNKDALKPTQIQLEKSEKVVGKQKIGYLQYFGAIEKGNKRKSIITLKALGKLGPNQ